MSNDPMQEISIPLDERNLAHVLSAITLSAMITRAPDAVGADSTCLWDSGAFVLRTAMSREALFHAADHFVRSMHWLPGIGTAEQGTFVAGDIAGSNPFISLLDNGQEKSPFKTFSGRVDPGKDLLQKQRASLIPPGTSVSWISQIGHGISSWGFDWRVGSHAYDQGSSSNEEGSGHLDPIYTAVELLSIAAASFFAPVHAWQSDPTTVRYSAWHRAISVSLAPYASGGLLDNLPARRYRTSSRGAAYGSGAAYRFFPEATILS